MIEVVRYEKSKKAVWDEFVRSSDVPVFMFERNYMEYHANRFKDYSLMIFHKSKLVALFPGHLNDNVWNSHKGLTFGGLISKPRLHYDMFHFIWDETISFLRNAEIKKIEIKNPPFFYLKSGSMASDFHLQQIASYQKDENLGAYINCAQHEFPKSTIEKRKLNLEQFCQHEDDDFPEFWPLLEENLSKFHNVRPVHSIKEIEHLKALFPGEIRLFGLRNKTDNNIDAATVLYDSGSVLKMQYIATSNRGRTNRAIHALYYSIISKYREDKTYIDIGSCMDKGAVNTKLLYLKERFGANVYFSNNYSLEI